MKDRLYTVNKYNKRRVLIPSNIPHIPEIQTGNRYDWGGRSQQMADANKIVSNITSQYNKNILSPVQDRTFSNEALASPLNTFVNNTNQMLQDGLLYGSNRDQTLGIDGNSLMATGKKTTAADRFANNVMNGFKLTSPAFQGAMNLANSGSETAATNAANTLSNNIGNSISNTSKGLQSFNTGLTDWGKISGAGLLQGTNLNSYSNVLGVKPSYVANTLNNSLTLPAAQTALPSLSTPALNNALNIAGFTPKNVPTYLMGSYSKAALDDFSKSASYGLANAANPNYLGALGTTAKVSKGLIKSLSETGAKLSNLAKTGISVAGTVVGQGANALLSHGLQTNTGQWVNNVGSALGTAASYIPGVGWIAGPVVSALSGIVAGGINGGWGHKIYNTAQAQGYLNNMSGIKIGGNTDSIASLAAALPSYGKVTYKDGWFTNKGKNQAAQWNQRLENTQNFLNRSINNAATNNIRNQIAQQKVNMSAFGGPIDGPSDYSFASDMVTSNNSLMQQQNRITSMPNSFMANSADNVMAEGGEINIKKKNRGRLTELKKRTGKTEAELWKTGDKHTRAMITFARNSRKWKHAYGGLLNDEDTPLFALGGDLQTHGADWSNGVKEIDTGGTHEDNPNEGVQMGVDQNGTPNLVEEGEVVWNDFVFSNRLNVPKDFRKEYGLRGRQDITFADAVKKLQKESEERPNDPISQAGLNSSLSALAECQEELKQKMQQDKAKEEFAQLPPEQQQKLLQMIAQQAQQQQAQQQQAQEQQAAQEEQAAQEQQMAQQQGAPQEEQGGMVNPEQQQATEEQAAMQQQDAAMQQQDMAQPNMGAYGGTLYKYGGKISDFMMKYLRKMGLSEKDIRESNEFDFNKFNLDTNTPSQDLLNAITRISSTKITYPDRITYNKANANPTAAQVNMVNINPNEFNAAAVQNQRDLDALAMGKNNVKVLDFLKGLGYKTTVDASKAGWTPEDFGVKYWNDLTGRTTMPENFNWTKNAEAYAKRISDPATKAALALGWNPTLKKHEARWYEGTGGNKVGWSAAYNKKELTADEYKEYLQRYKNTLGWADKHGLIKAPEAGKTISMADIAKAMAQSPDWIKTDAWLYDDPASKEHLREYLGRAMQLGDPGDEKFRKAWEKWGIWSKDDNNKWDYNYKKGLTNDEYKAFLDYFQKSRTDNFPGVMYNSMENPEEVTTNYLIDKDGNLLGVASDTTGLKSAGNGVSWGDDKDFINKNVKFFMAPEEQEAKKEDPNAKLHKVPIVHDDRLKYAPLFGGLLGLGMQAAGFGKPDNKNIDAALAAATPTPIPVGVKTIGNYMTYKPLDTDYSLNILRSAAGASRNAVLNSGAGPGKRADLMQLDYNYLGKQGDAFRAENAQNFQNQGTVANFNRGTDITNLQAINNNQENFANRWMQQKQLWANASLDAARQKDESRATWYGGIYQNIGNIANSLGSIGRENTYLNQRNREAASGVYGALDPNAANGAGIVQYMNDEDYAKYQKRMARLGLAAYGGQLNTRKKKRGMTF